jgi:hypothetical protein
MTTAQNQTDQNDLKSIDPATSPGSGVFAIPDPTSSDFGAMKKEIVYPITYAECVRRGFLCAAFKWVPRELSTANKDDCPTKGAPCVDDCAAQDLCLCVFGRCQ